MPILKSKTGGDSLNADFRVLAQMANEREERAQRQPRRGGGIDARTIKAMMKHRRVGQRAREWAEATLHAAGLPSEVGFYSPDSDGRLVRARDDLTPEEQDRIVAAGGAGMISWLGSRKLGAAVPWVDSLPSALGRIGYGPGTPERDAAELLELLANAAYYIHEGEAGQAASAAFFAGMLWQARRDDDDAATGRRVRSGGRKGAKLTSDNEAHVRWLFADNMLKREGTRSDPESPKEASLTCSRTGYGSDVWQRSYCYIKLGEPSHSPTMLGHSQRIPVQ